MRWVRSFLFAALATSAARRISLLDGRVLEDSRPGA